MDLNICNPYFMSKYFFVLHFSKSYIFLLKLGFESDFQWTSMAGNVKNLVNDGCFT